MPSAPAPDQRLAQTRRRVLSAARELFLTRGYDATTVDAIARHAGVSVQSVYNAAGRKQAVLKGVWDTTLTGDHAPVAMKDRPETLSIRDATDTRQALSMPVARQR